MTLEDKKIEIEEHFNLWVGNYSRSELTTNNVRIIGEAVCKAVILFKKGNILGKKIILGKEKSIPTNRIVDIGKPLVFADYITTLNEIISLPNKIKLQLDLIRDTTNPSSHSKNRKQDITTLEDLEICHTAIKSIINWLYESVLKNPVITFVVRIN